MIIRFLLSPMAIVLLLAAFNPPQTNEKAKLEQERKKLEQEIAFTKKLLQETEQNKYKSLNELTTLQKQIAIRQNLISNITRQINLLDENISETEDVIDALSNDLATLKTNYATMIRDAYKLDIVYNKIAFIFSAESFNRAYKRMIYLKHYAAFRKKQALLIEETQQSMTDKLKDIEVKKADKKKLLAYQQNQLLQLDREKIDKDHLVNILEDKQRNLKNELKEKEKASKKLNKEIEDLIAREIEMARKKAAAEKKTSKNVLSATPEYAKLTSGFVSDKGQLPWPVDKGIITETFGEHPHPVLKDIMIKNNGIDIKVEQNTQIKSIYEGEVRSVLFNPDFQNAVMIRHGEYFTIYSNLKEVYVKGGDIVKKDQVIGKAYTDPEDNRTTVHLEIWQGTNKLNPALWIKKQNQ